jgi:RNA polymerase-binding transcription factor DksA
MGSLRAMNDTPIDAEVARRRLDAERSKLQELVQGLQSEANPDDEQVGELEDLDHPASEHASETLEREKDLSILEGLEQELAEVEAALRRLDDGTYGVDEVTGEPIDPARLDALPAARTNVDTARD